MTPQRIILPPYKPKSLYIHPYTPTQQFFTDLTALFEVLAMHCCPVVVTGDLNVRIDRPTDPHGVHLSELLVSFDLVQHVAESTHDRGGILDLVITKSDDKASSNFS